MAGWMDGWTDACLRTCLITDVPMVLYASLMYLVAPFVTVPHTHTHTYTHFRHITYHLL